MPDELTLRMRLEIDSDYKSDAKGIYKLFWRSAQEDLRRRCGISLTLKGLDADLDPREFFTVVMRTDMGPMTLEEGIEILRGYSRIKDLEVVDYQY